MTPFKNRSAFWSIKGHSKWQCTFTFIAKQKNRTYFLPPTILGISNIYCSTSLFYKTRLTCIPFFKDISISCADLYINSKKKVNDIIRVVSASVRCLHQSLSQIAVFGVSVLETQFLNLNLNLNHKYIINMSLKKNVLPIWKHILFPFGFCHSNVMIQNHQQKQNDTKKVRENC